MPSRGGTVVVKIADYDAARRQVMDAALKQGGELLNSRTKVNAQGKKDGWVRFRIAADRLPRLLPDIHAVGKLFSEDIRTTDYTSEYEELQRRVMRLREHQQRLAGVLQSTRRLRGSDVLYLQERLFRAGVDEGMLLQRRADLERAARGSTLTVELFEPEARRPMDVGNWYAGASLRARADVNRYLAKATTAGAYVLFFAPFWIPALVIAVLLLRWLWRRGRVLLLWARARSLRAWEVCAARFPARPRRTTPPDPGPA
jgi:hypothetical protein